MSMKANVENLKKALQLCAEAHKVEFCDWSDEGQLALKSEDVPVLSDVKMIAEAFYGYGNTDVETDWGYTTLWIHSDFLEEVDEDVLSLALPNGWIDRLS